jgi:hypothetical protein
MVHDARLVHAVVSLTRAFNFLGSTGGDVSELLILDRLSTTLLFGVQTGQERDTVCPWQQQLDAWT